MDAKNIIIILLSIFCVSCVPVEDEFHHYGIVFYNNSNRDIYVDNSWGYPYTTYFHPSASLKANSESCRVDAHGINKSVFFSPWGTIERNFVEYGDTMVVFVFDAEIVDKTNDSEKPPILQRIKVTLDDLRKTNWTMVYPQ